MTVFFLSRLTPPPPSCGLVTGKLASPPPPCTRPHVNELQHTVVVPGTRRTPASKGIASRTRAPSQGSMLPSNGTIQPANISESTEAVSFAAFMPVTSPGDGGVRWRQSLGLLDLFFLSLFFPTPPVRPLSRDTPSSPPNRRHHLIMGFVVGRMVGVSPWSEREQRRLLPQTGRPLGSRGIAHAPRGWASRSCISTGGEKRRGMSEGRRDWFLVGTREVGLFDFAR